MAVLFAFIGGAFSFRGSSTAVGTFAANFSTDLVGIVTIAALAFITFFGFSAIAASAGEIIEPKQTVPRAIAASIITVTVLYALVMVVGIERDGDHITPNDDTQIKLGDLVPVFSPETLPEQLVNAFDGEPWPANEQV